LKVLSSEAFIKLKEKLLQQQEDDFLFFNNTFMKRKYIKEEGKKAKQLKQSFDSGKECYDYF